MALTYPPEAEVVPEGEPSFYPPSGELLPPLDRLEVLDLADDLAGLNSKNTERESSEAIKQLCSEILHTESEHRGYDVTKGNEYVIVSRRGNGREASLGRAIEARVFADRFERSPEEVMDDYGPYDEASDFIICIDPKTSLPVGAIRITTNGPLGMPDFNVLATANKEDNYQLEPIPGADERFDPETYDASVDPYHPSSRGAIILNKDGSPKLINPWFDEIQDKYVMRGEDVTERELLQRVMFGAGFRDRARSATNVDIDSILDRTLNVATMSVLAQYSRGQSIPGPSTAMYNGVLRKAKSEGAVFLAAIQDEVPYYLLNAFGAPFKELGLSHLPFGGPFDTIPSFCDLRTALLRMERDPDMGESARFLIEQELSEQGVPEQGGYYIFPFEANGWWADKDEYGRKITSTNGHSNGNGKHP